VEKIDFMEEFFFKFLKEIVVLCCLLYFYINMNMLIVQDFK